MIQLYQNFLQASLTLGTVFQQSTALQGVLVFHKVSCCLQLILYSLFQIQFRNPLPQLMSVYINSACSYTQHTRTILIVFLRNRRSSYSQWCTCDCHPPICYYQIPYLVLDVSSQSSFLISLAFNLEWSSPSLLSLLIIICITPFWIDIFQFQ